MKTWHLKKAEIAVAAFILLFSIGLRINAPRADLPSHITFSGSILTDEGNQCHNSRSKALYGQWYPDDWRITNYNPILPWIKYSIFKLFGVGLLQLRLVNYLFAAVSLLFFFFTLKSYFRDQFKFALLGTLFLGINFLYVMYNKIGTFETSIIFWVILTLYFLEKYRWGGKSLFLILAGASTFMAVIFKSIMAYILPLPFAAYILVILFSKVGDTKTSIKKVIFNMLFILLGIMILFIPWYLFHYLPNREWIISAPGQYMGNLMFPRNLETAFGNILTFPWGDQFYKIPIVWLGAVLYVPVFFRRLLSKQARLTEIGYTLFFFAHTAVFLVMSYRPTRYFIPVIPAMVFMTVVLFQHWASAASSPGKRIVNGFIEKSVIFVLDFSWLSLAAYFCLIPLLTRYFISIPRPRLSLYYFLVAAVLVTIVYLLRSGYRKYQGKLLNFKYVFIILIVLMTTVSLVINMSYYWQWNTNKTYSIRDISRELGEKLDNAYIAGMTSTVAVLENRHKALWLFPNFVNWDAHTFEKYPLTHALLGTDVSHEIIHFFNQWPERMNQARLLKIYPLKNYVLHLYSFVDPYIYSCSVEDDQTYRLKVVNPTKHTIETRIGTVYFIKNNPDEKSQQTNFQVVNGQEAFTLKTGENEILVSLKDDIPLEPIAVLFFLDYSHPFDKTLPRYEGENFPGKIGINKKMPQASNGYIRYVDSTRQAPGFLSYGPAVPFARGFLIVDFHLKFDHLKTKIRPLCQLDIYSHEDKGPVAQRAIRPADIRKAGSHTYRLSTIIPGTKTLEFRIQTEKWSDVAFDYIDVTYYQGYIVNF